MVGLADASGFSSPEPLLVEEVRQAMRGAPRALPPGMAHDAIGHALFARVTALPGYGLARAEAELLRTHRDEILDLAGNPGEIVDLQAGDAVPARPLLDRMKRYVAIERRRSILDDAIVGLRAAFPSLTVEGVHGEGIAHLAALPQPEGPRLALLLGSVLGRLDPTAARLDLWRIRAAMAPGDRVLVGVDLDKEPSRLQEAYDDPSGIYAAFARNAFRRSNREVGTDFCAAEWDYRVEAQPAQGRVEIRFEARQDVHVCGGHAGGCWRFSPGAPLVAEHAYKPSEAQVAALALGAGLRVAGAWVDAGQGYGLFMLRA